jgi:hypothetical protein
MALNRKASNYALPSNCRQKPANDSLAAFNDVSQPSTASNLRQEGRVGKLVWKAQPTSGSREFLESSAREKQT